MKYLKYFENDNNSIIGTKVGDSVVYTDEEDWSGRFGYGDSFIVSEIFGIVNGNFVEKDAVDQSVDYIKVEGFNIKFQAHRFTPEFEFDAKKYNI